MSKDLRNSIIGNIVKLLEEAESSLPDAISQAVQGHEMDLAGQLLGLAKRIEDIRKEAEGLKEWKDSSIEEELDETDQSGIKFFVDRGKLVMSAPNRRGGHYMQRVLKGHYDLVISKLIKIAGLAGSRKAFALFDLTNRQEMPVHEPGVVVRMLIQKGLLKKIQRGHYEFVSPNDFATRVQEIWARLPKG